MRAAALANAENGDANWQPRDVDLYPSFRAFARYIAKHEQPPIDPLLVMAREAMLEAWKTSGVFNNAHLASCIRDGKFDTNLSVQSALTALRMAKEQGLPDFGHKGVFE